jgi:DNA modification methylase
MRRLIAASSTPNGLVLDPFVGSGTTALVAESMKRRWIAGDLDARYIGLTRKRLGQAAQSRN